MANCRISSADLFLLVNFAEYVALRVRGRQPYDNRLQNRQLSTQDREMLDRVRQPSAERLATDSAYWLRTCYDPSAEAEKIFLRMPQLLEAFCTLEEYEENIQEALSEAIEAHALDPELAEEEGYDPVEDAKPWPMFHSDYHMQLVIGRIHVVDATTLASEGRNAGKVLVVWFDECGRAIRYSREALEDASDIAGLSNYMLNEYGCWVNAKIGQPYQWGQPLGPPYGENGGDSD
ncbi:hypothetical protein BDW59DRAFT_175633 [Aspergillus cavernicola]|uniref:Uncharacterized protein n=1 Tax=Aspergillus cavernicola TaxID=176166 RepID=A0ABR4HNF1_9EURO